MTERPDPSPAPDPTPDPTPDPFAHLDTPAAGGRDGEADPLGPTGAPPPRPWNDPVEEEGLRFAREADEDDGPPSGGGSSGGGTGGGREDLSPDFLAPTQPS